MANESGTRFVEPGQGATVRELVDATHAFQKAANRPYYSRFLARLYRTVGMKARTNLAIVGTITEQDLERMKTAEAQR